MHKSTYLILRHTNFNVRDLKMLQLNFHGMSMTQHRK